MLANDPPKGTEVRFLREVEKAARGNVGRLVGPLRKYFTESADDEFEVEFMGEKIIVRRSDIDKA